jgi:YbgC/YbaW family acyl-CoA thioester hydrolase
MALSEHVVDRRIEFVDTDMGGIVHFSRYPVFIETAEHRFREVAGHRVHETDGDGRPIGWPRVSMTVDYHSPARFGDTLSIRMRVVRMGEKSMTFGFDVRVGVRRIVSGTMTSVCCVLDPRGEVRGIPIPDGIRTQFAVVGGAEREEGS